MRKRYGIYIGSFDPVHEGHEQIISKAKTAFDLTRIFVSVATDSNPRKKYFYNGQQRASLLESALLPYENFVEVDRSQIDGLSDHPLTSVDLLAEKLGPEADLYVIVGQDVYETFATIYDLWLKKPDRYLRTFNWIVVRRGESASLLLPENVLGASSLDLGQSFHTGDGGAVHFVDFAIPDCSSSQVKTFLQNVEEIPGCFMCTRQFYREILDTPRFYLLYNEFPLMEGHLLIVSKEHVGSTGFLSQSALTELYVIKQRVAQVLREMYGSAAFYENGRRTCCIARNEDRHITNHFHLNAIPFAGDITPALRAKHKELQVENLFSLREHKGVYYYFERNDGSCFFYDIEGKPAEHNTLRSLIAEQIGHLERAFWSRDTVLVSQTAEGPELFSRLRKAFRPDCRVKK